MSERIIYAGGARGPNARADGRGGLMPRGWYVRRPMGGHDGPFKSRAQAVAHWNAHRPPGDPPES